MTAVLKLALTTQKLAVSTALTTIGVLLVTVAVTGTVAYSLCAPLEWAGVFCLAAEFAYVFSPSSAVAFGFLASMLGAVMDPVLIQGQSVQMWVIANLLVFVSAIAGICVNIVIKKLGVALRPYL